MASASSTKLILNPPFSLSNLFTRTSSASTLQFQAQTRLKQNPKSPYSFRIQSQRIDASNEDIVIVGAGIAGLATAVSLQRLGIGCKVVEQADSLRTGGTSLTLFKNGWRILDAIGVGNLLRPQFLTIKGVDIKTEEGKELRSFNFDDEDQSQEVRAVERRILLETLANQLHPNSISFSSKLQQLETQENGDLLLHFENGNHISSKVVVACDGIRSPVAKWMGFSEANYVGHYAIRGLGIYPNGHQFEPRVNYIYGRGVRAGFVPVSPTKVYWFVCFNSSSLGPKITDPSIIKQQTKELIKNWGEDLLNIIDRTPNDTIIRTPLVDRWLWPKLSPSPSKGRVVLVGDAWHPMTPNLGQGACCALEDSITLAKMISDFSRNGEKTSIEDAFKAYEKKRWGRIFPLTIQASLVGKLLQWGNPLVCYVRNNVLMPKVRLGPMLKHTDFDFEPLS